MSDNSSLRTHDTAMEWLRGDDAADSIISKALIVNPEPASCYRGVEDDSSVRTNDGAMREWLRGEDNADSTNVQWNFDNLVLAVRFLSSPYNTNSGL